MKGKYSRLGARAYDIKHYNYYLNSSRIAPGVAVYLSVPPLSLSRFIPPIMYLSLFLRLFFLFLSRVSSLFLSPHRSPNPLVVIVVVSYSRRATRFLLSYTGRSPRSGPILLLFEVALLLLRPRVGATHGTETRRNGHNHRPDLTAIATMRWFIAET